MSEERRRILEMLKQGKINVSEAEELLDAVGELAGGEGPAEGQEPTAPVAKEKPKYLRIAVEDKEDHVDVRVPMQLLRSGIKLGALIPQSARTKIGEALSEKGLNIDLANLTPEMIEELIEGMGELSVDVEEKGGAKVRIFCE